MTGSGAVRDVVELLVRRANRFGRWPAIRFRSPAGEEQSLSWSDWLEQSWRMANALRSAGVRPGDRVAIFARNSPQWLVADMGILMLGAVSAPISRSAPAAARARMLLELAPKVVFVGDLDDLARLRENRKGLEQATQVVLLHPPPEELPDDERWGGGGRPARFGDLLIRGKAILDRGDGIRPESSGRDPGAPATIVYTAGRSGPARGVVISHQSLMLKLRALRDVVVLPRSATQLLLLPLAGIFGHLMAWAAIDQGATTFIRNPGRGLRDDILAARPHFIAGAPAHFDLIREIILARRDGAMGLPGRITLQLSERHLAGAGGGASVGRGGAGLAITRRLLRTRVRHLLGGRIQHLVCGGGLVDESVESLFELADLPLLTGYGSSETIAVATANRLDRRNRGSVGLPLGGVELRLSPAGEVLVRGGGLFSGYLRPSEPGSTEVQVLPALDPDGWYHTGDLGLIENDFLFLTGRKEDIITLRGGRVVAPALIESALCASERVAHAVACGEGEPHVGVLLWLCEEASSGRVGRDEEQRDLQRLIDRTNQGLERHEQIGAFRVVPGALSVEEGEVSANGEPIRALILRRHREQVDALFGRHR